MTPDEIRQHACARFGEPNRAMSTRTELRFGRKGSVSVALTGSQAGAWYDHEAGTGGYVAPAAAQYSWPERREPDLPQSAPTFARLIRDLRTVDGTPAETYLRSRGNAHWPVLSVAWSQSHHACIFFARTISGERVAAQAVYLRPDGTKNTAHEPAVKQTYAAIRHWHEIAAVRMPGRGAPILAEGPETALAIWHAFNRTRPVYACLGISGLGALYVSQKRITIAADGNAPGSQADSATGRALAMRAANGQTVTLAAPEPPHDWDDIRRDHGHAAVRDAIAAAEKADK